MRRFFPVLFPFAGLLVVPGLAQSPHLRPDGSPASRTATPTHVVALPVTHVSLYKNGVGFFEHTGHVSGDATVTLDFTTAQLDDVLQSLTAIDLSGGRISGAGFNSTSPLEQQLKNLALGLPADTTFSAFLTALRGSRVEVTGSQAPFIGRLMDVETHKTEAAGKTDATMSDTSFLSVVSDTGTLRIFPVTPALSVRLLDTALHTDVTRYLQLLDSSRNQGVRHLTLRDRGTGTREIHLSYLSEVPIWKSTYRILCSGSNASAEPLPETATIQGWSVVDNTTGTDWVNVHLSLVAGVPQSFIQPLSQPIYGRRPVVPVAQDPQLTPQTYDSSIEGVPASIQMLKQDAPPPPSAGVAGMTGVSGGEPMPVMAGSAPGGVLGGIADGAGKGIGAGSGGNIGGGVMRRNDALSYEEAESASITPQTTTAAFDDFFAYDLKDPVTLHQNESALVPILQAKVPIDRVTLVTSDGNSVQQPLRALWITNTSGLTMDRGSFTVVENGSFGGQGLLDPIHAGEKRLLSYASDQAVHVATESNLNSDHVNHVTATKGILKLQHSEIREIGYTIHNSAAEARHIVLEHPIFPGFELDSTPAATETTATVYRFRQVVAPGKTEHLHVSERHQGTTTYVLTRSDDNQIEMILNQSGHNAALEAALQPVLQARRRVADTQTTVDQTTNRLTALHSDEDRQRANINALGRADKRSRDRFVGDLNHTEDAIKAAQAELAMRTATLDAAKADLSNSIEALQIDEAL